MSSVSRAPISSEPVIQTLEERPAAIVRVETPVSHLGEAIGIAIAEVSTVLAARGSSPAGPPFAHYLSWGADMVVAEVGFPVTGPIEPQWRVVGGTIPGGRVAVSVHHGPYDRIGETYAQLDRWIRARGDLPGRTMWEVYLRGPADEPDPTNWETAVHWPVE